MIQQPPVCVFLKVLINSVPTFWTTANEQNSFSASDVTEMIINYNCEKEEKSAEPGADLS